ncbi:unnamed protein product [Schistosoma turkestanicum]|nr:unnamed protein product [Schistosoma turkestanicum]
MTSSGPYFVCDYIKQSTIQIPSSQSIPLSNDGLIKSQSQQYMDKSFANDNLSETYTEVTSIPSSYIDLTNIKEDYQLNLFNNNNIISFDTLFITVQHNSTHSYYFTDGIPLSISFICQAIDIIWNYIPPLIFFIGTIGNLFSLLVFYKRTNLYPSSCVYLIFLAIVDEGVLLTGLLRRWLDILLLIRLEDRHWFLCKSTQFIGVTTSYISVWIIVLITVERTIIVMSPISSIYTNRIKRSYISIIILCILASIVSVHFFITVDLVTVAASHLIYFESNNNTNSLFTINENYSKLDVNSSSFSQLMTNVINSHDSNALICDFYYAFKQNGFQTFWIWIDATLYSYLPFMIILISNILILINMHWATKQRANLIGKVASTKRLYRCTDNSKIIVQHLTNRKIDNLPLRMSHHCLSHTVSFKNQPSTCSSQFFIPKNETIQLRIASRQIPSAASFNSFNSDEIHNDNNEMYNPNNDNNNNNNNNNNCKHPNVVNIPLQPYNKIQGISIKTTNLIEKPCTFYYNEMRQLTILLLLISGVFLLTTAPVALVKLLLAWKIQLNLHNMALFELFDCIAEVLMYTNHAINFYLYCAVGSRFRRELKKIFYCQTTNRRKCKHG